MGPEGLWGTLDILVRLSAAYVMALALGLERSRSARTTGMRTFPLVALGACGYALLAQFIGDSSPDAQARVIQGLISGIGFIGGGAILKGQAEIHGLATAASLWNTAAIGMAAAYGRYDLGIILACINFVTLHLFVPRKDLEPEPEGRGEQRAPEDRRE